LSVDEVIYRRGKGVARAVTGPDQPSTVTAGNPPAARVSAWAPFHHRLYAAMWGGQFVSNIGGWMQTVAAQWLMLSLTTSATYVALERTRYGRRRTGATNWRAWRDAAATGRILEQFVVASWDDHLRQHERVTKHDQERLDRVREMTDPDRPVTVTHWLAVTWRNQ
jgi:hypothetical protein